MPEPTPDPLEVEADLIVISYPNSKGESAYIAHWTIELPPGRPGHVTYPFAEGDVLEVSLSAGTSRSPGQLQEAEFTGPDGAELLRWRNLGQMWRGDVVVTAEGLHEFRFHNPDLTEENTIHLLVTYA